jgi:hypothetical protein
MREKNFGVKGLPEGKKDDSVRCDKGKLKFGRQITFK